ncbi:large extracellular alpha-helical protein [Aequorivita sublithincola DSM 14238]|uniref:Large extracellular alpha-helical protein n=1 Tax=Aequorivita sublithincola (strain DSM 14238 / LMG 21431 / ACAM 643 / 9-3) TaxID=746697 RepID=I3YUC6_AEQSU|nr:Ig-like domain-containing alpha-2-macroglobulin family protein [Aequorivita sublithincola]AFL80594.1 large extracellular alpha-helical protein [Aequorivita sublithincola DSM 14238]
MKTSLKFLSVVLLLFVFSCKDKDQHSETDNLFKFKEYISYNTFGNQSITTDIRVELSKPLEQFELTQELSAEEYLSISPKTSGKLVVENGKTLVFHPSENLKADTEYSVTVKLNKFYEDIAKEFKSYTFSFHTITPNFKVDIGKLQSYSKQWQYVEASVEASDVISLEKAKQLVSASQNGKNLKLKWPSETTDARYFNFTIDSISRKMKDSEILIKWDGKSIDAENKGENTFAIPGQNNFTIVSISSTLAPAALLSINFSDPLLENQDFAGLVTIENTSKLRYEVNGNVLNVYPSNRIVGNVKVTVFTGIKNTEGFGLKKEFSELVSFEQLKPAVRMISKGVILPNSTSTPVYFEAVNLSKVDVRVIKIYENNVLQFLQSYDLNDNNTYDIKRVGRRIAKKTIDLKNAGLGSDNSWKAYAINLSEYFKADPGAIYQLELSFKKEYIAYDCTETTSEATEENDDEEDEYYDDYYEEDSYYAEDSSEDEELREERYWDNEIYRWRNYNYNWQQQDNPCHSAYYNQDRVVTSNILGSDLGLIVKKGNNRSYHFIATNLISAKPEGGVKIKLFNYQQQLIETVTSDGDGMTLYDGTKNAAFAVAQKGNNFAYVKLEDGNALSMSNFDISGKELQKGLKGYAYTERGVYRPGDSIHLTFVLNDNANPLPKNHPVTLSVTDARGKLVQRSVLSSQNSAVSKGFYYFPIATDASAPTGNWNATITVGGAQFSHTLKVATIKPNRLKIKLDFDDEILDATKPVKGTASAMWLHGSPARNLKIDMTATLRSSNTAFPKFSKYNFIDPIRTFSEVEIPVLDTQLSSEGVTAFSQKMEVGKNAPGMLKATFLTKVYEGGGDFSMDIFSKDLAPFSHFVGLKSPEAGRYGSYFTDENTSFDVVSVDAQGKAAANRELDVKVFQIEWRWWWNRGSDNLSSYENSTVHRPVKEFKIKTNGSGKGKFTVNIPEEEGGRYLIRVIDKESGHATGRITYFYRNWWQRPSDGDSESSRMLVFSADKEKYNVDDEAFITFPSGSDGRALISVENGTEVLATHWIETKKGETKAAIKITKEMAPNIYVNISLLQPHSQTKNDLPIRLYGVIPLLVEDPSTVLHPKINMPNVLKPEEKFTVKVSEEKGKAMTYTLAVVDEGLLDLTRFKTPPIHEAFYSREALGVKTFDMFDYVIGAYSGSVDNIYAIGGGDVAEGAKNRKADRFKPVVKYLGPFELAAGKTATHNILMPNYVGSVRTMVIVGDNAKSAYGNAEKTTPVRTPLMVLASLPRKLSPGEKVTLPVTVFAMENKVKSATITVKTGAALKPINGSSKTVSFSSPGEQIVNFEFEVLPTKEFQTIEVTASGNGEKASYKVEIDVENPNPISQKSTNYTLEVNASQTINFETFGVPGSNTAMLEFSTLPPMDFGKRLEFLIHYPYGCLEQTTSSGFPQLYMADVFDIPFNKKQKIEKNVKSTIERLGRFQLSNGGLSYWPGEREADEWSTNYAGHFMLEAKQKGYALPISFMSNWLLYQQNTARQWRNSYKSYNSSLTQAYRLYTLALAGKPELAAMNRLRESKELSNDGKWRLAAAYALAGKKNVAQQIAQTANINFVPQKHDYYTYGSPFRNRVMALETLVLLGDAKQRDLAISVAKDLSSGKWYSTQETSYALMAMAKMVEKNGGKSMELTFTNGGKSVALKTDRAIAQRDLSFVMGGNSVSVTNKKGNVIYVTLSQKGKLPLGQELAEQRNLSIKSQYLDGAGKPIDVTKLRQGTEIIAKVSITNTSGDWINNVALAKIFPTGWEIVNTSFSELGGGASGNARYTDIRDDRVNFFFDLNRNETKTFTVKLNASYLGTYYLPGTQVEAMYDNSYYARNNGMWVTIEQ